MGKGRTSNRGYPVFEKYNLLKKGTIQAHCTFLDSGELDQLVANQTAVAHCPLSNAYFSEKPFPLREALDKGVPVGLGTDVAGGYSIDILSSMRHAVATSRMREGARALASKSGVSTGNEPKTLAVEWKESLFLATRGGALALGLENSGHFQVGASFDAQEVSVIDWEKQAGVGGLDFFDVGSEMDGLTMDMIEKWWCMGDTRNRAGMSPSRLVIPPAPRHTPSLPAFQPHGSTSPPIQPTTELESSASSVINLDISDGILVHDVDAEVETTVNEESTAVGQIGDIADEQSRKTLRDQLRRTLSKKEATGALLLLSDISVFKRGLAPQSRKSTASCGPCGPFKPREYFVLTDAGKPVFIGYVPHPKYYELSSTMGIIQALISVFIDDGDKIRCINAGPLRITFLLRSPIYYVCASTWGEPESVARSHLEYLHLQILSIVTASQLRRIFERRTNFDLRRLLNGTEPFLFTLLKRLEFDLAMATSSLHCLQLDPSLRSRVADALVPMTKMKDTLYIILVAHGRVITLVRPRKHSIHPTDIHIIVNTIHSPSIFNSPAAASWIPVCLPKFNPAGFVNAYVAFLRKPESNEMGTSNIDASSLDVQGRVTNAPQQAGQLDAGIGLVCISGGGDFETVREWCDIVAEKLNGSGLLDSICDAIKSGRAHYTVSQLGIPGLRHFVYKSRPHVQVTFPVFEDPYEEIEERRRIITLYGIIYDAIHAKSGQSGPLKLQYIRTKREIVMGWITQPFELYIVLSPRLPKTAVINAANSVTRWVKKEEGKLFLRDAPVF
ncbi:trafficking protein Mon1-domain-containing protein [Chiua virens]|nr:trafficking protein Mon1-domain-containing protein [Chiua virens]